MFAFVVVYRFFYFSALLPLFLLPQVLAGLLTWWLGGVGGEGESQENNFFLTATQKAQKG